MDLALPPLVPAAAGPDELAAAAETLCRLYSRTPGPVLRDAVAAQLAESSGETAGWLAVLLACVHYDLGDRTAADGARRTALGLAEALHEESGGHAELVGWAWELAAWFALVEGRYAEAVRHARAGRAVAGASSAGVQLALQEARACSRLRDREGAEAALQAGAAMLAALPPAAHPDNHFVFDASKWDFFAATCYVQLGDDDRAEALATAGIARHRRPDGSTDAPMRTAGAQLDLALVHARRGHLDEALAAAGAAFGHARSSTADLLARARDVQAVLAARFPGEPRVVAFGERLAVLAGE